MSPPCSQLMREIHALLDAKREALKKTTSRKSNAKTFRKHVVVMKCFAATRFLALFNRIKKKRKLPPKDCVYLEDSWV